MRWRSSAGTWARLSSTPRRGRGRSRGRGRPERRRPCNPRARPVLRRRARRGTADRGAGRRATDAPDRPEGYVVSLGLLALLDAEQGRTESAEAWARQAISFARKRSQADSWRATLAHLGPALACTATGRLEEAEREALRGERLRRSPQPTVGHAHALLVLAQVRVARSRLARAASDLKRAQTAIAEFRDPGRLPTIAAAIEQDLAAHANPRNLDMVEEPSAAELAVLRGLATDLSRREIGARLYISMNTVKTHIRELYRKLDVTSRAEAVARAEALGLGRARLGRVPDQNMRSSPRTQSRRAATRRHRRYQLSSPEPETACCRARGCFQLRNRSDRDINAPSYPSDHPLRVMLTRVIDANF